MRLDMKASPVEPSTSGTGVQHCNGRALNYFGRHEQIAFRPVGPKPRRKPRRRPAPIQVISPARTHRCGARRAGSANCTMTRSPPAGSPLPRDFCWRRSTRSAASSARTVRRCRSWRRGLAISISAVTHAMRPLVRDGLVRLQPDARDRRTKHAGLTPARARALPDDARPVGRGQPPGRDGARASRRRNPPAPRRRGCVRRISGGLRFRGQTRNPTA